MKTLETGYGPDPRNLPCNLSGSQAPRVPASALPAFVKFIFQQGCCFARHGFDPIDVPGTKLKTRFHQYALVPQHGIQSTLIHCRWRR